MQGGAQRESAPPPLLQPPPQLAALRDAAVAAGLAASGGGSSLGGPGLVPSDPRPHGQQHQMVAFELAALQGGVEMATIQAGQPHSEHSGQAGQRSEEEEEGDRAAAATASPAAAGGGVGGASAAATPTGVPAQLQQLGGAGADLRPQPPAPEQGRQQQPQRLLFSVATGLHGVRIKEEADADQSRSQTGLMPDPAAEFLPQTDRGQSGAGVCPGDGGPGAGSSGFARDVGPHAEGHAGAALPESSAGEGRRYTGGGSASAVRQRVGAAAAPAASASDGSCSSIDG